MEKLIVPVVFATDDGYAPYLGVALHSLITHTTSNNEYRIYIMFTKLSKEHQRRLQSLECENVIISFIDINDKVAGLKDYMTSHHFTVETTYRLFISEILFKYPKIIYLDCDIILTEDVAKLFLIDIKDSILGVSRIIINYNWSDRIMKVLDLAYNETFNAGILIINTQQFIKNNIKEKCLDLLQEDWKLEKPIYICPDQDVLNITCKDKLTFFPMNWNFMWNMHLSEKPIKETILPELYDEYIEAQKDIKIIHYDTAVKPWNAPEHKYADIFWKYARETVFYEEILIKETIPKNAKFRYTFPWKSIKAGSTIVIYGGGDVGQEYLKQINMTSYCCISAICDQNAKRLKNLIIPVVVKEELSEVKFDYILIAIDSEEIAETVRKDLINLGIDNSKIKWK